MSYEEKSGKEQSIFGKEKNPSAIEPKKLTLDSHIKFRCHPGVRCFTACCGGIKIILTPYDILMLSKRLGIPAHEFLEKHTQPTYLEKTDMPGVMIKLREDDNKCPFVTPEGCTVYTDRPTACRYYPVGMADFHEGGTRDANGIELESAEDKFYFIVREDHCKGFAEDQPYTVAEWFENQGLVECNTINDEVLTLLQHEKVSKDLRLTKEQKENFLLALYKLDEFRELVSSPGFQDEYKLSEEERDSALSDDLQLLRFGIRWLKETLFTEKNE